MIFKNDANVDDEELVKALDKKYDTLLDKLALDALKKQLGKYISNNISTIQHSQINCNSILKNVYFSKLILLETV